MFPCCRFRKPYELQTIYRHFTIVNYDGYGAIQVLRNADGGGGSDFLEKKRYEGVMFNVISITRGWVGVQFPEK